MGLDPGSRRCGVAVSDTRRTMAFPRPALAVDEGLVGSLADLIAEEDVTTVVIGHPLALSGRATSSTEVAGAFADKLRARVASLEIVRWDERLTTHEATRALREAGHRGTAQRGRVDSAAAVILLQNFLDAWRRD